LINALIKPSPRPHQQLTNSLKQSISEEVAVSETYALNQSYKFYEKAALLNNSVRVFTRRLSAWAQLMMLYNMRWWGWRRVLHQKWRKTS